MSLCSRERRVFFFEEPIVSDGPSRLSVRNEAQQLFIVTPHIAAGESVVQGQRKALRELCRRYGIEVPILWFCTPTALEFAREMVGSLTVYDCMSELSALRGASPSVQALERELLARADLVFTAGMSLLEQKRPFNSYVYCFPNGVDVAHFASARAEQPEPEDQAHIPCPRVGYFGVLDERLDLKLLARAAALRPELQFVLVGPVSRIEPSKLPQAANIHYLGQKSYEELPRYLSRWDVTMTPFRTDASARLTSPTQTLEYLAGGKPVVSTALPDVVQAHAAHGAVRVAEGANAFVAAIDQALQEGGRPRDPRKQRQLDALIASNSWESTWSKMSTLMAQALSTGEVELDLDTTPISQIKVA